jgi:hypothetical protein
MAKADDPHAFGVDRTAATRLGDHLDRFDDVMDQRALLYQKLAELLVISYLPDAADPVALLAEALQTAYRAGARDMHTAVAEQLQPLWILAGLEP